MDSAWDSKSLDCSMSQIRIPRIAEFLLIRGLFLLFLFSLDRAAFWPCFRKCLRSAASLLCCKFKMFFRGKQSALKMETILKRFTNFLNFEFSGEPGLWFSIYISKRLPGTVAQNRARKWRENLRKGRKRWWSICEQIRLWVLVSSLFWGATLSYKWKQLQRHTIIAVIWYRRKLTEVSELAVFVI